MFQAVISADLMGRVYTAVSAEESRYYLNGVKVEPCPLGGALLIATDGHKMLVLRDAVAVVNETAIVRLSPAMLKACRAKAVKRGVYGERFLIVDEQRAAVALTAIPENRGDLLDLARNPNHEVECYQPAGTLIDASYPDWRRVVPNGQVQAVAAAFNSEYVSAVSKALCTCRAPVATLQGRGGSIGDAANAPHAVYGDGTVPGFGVLMPIRSKPLTEHELPYWLNAAPNAVPIKKTA